MIKIFLIIAIIFITGCSKSIIKYATKLDENPYQMYGKTPSRNFNFSSNISDSLILKWESDAYGGFTNSSVSVYDNVVFINDLAGRVFCFNIETGKTIGSVKYSTGSIFSTPIAQRSRIIFPVALERDNLTELVIYDYTVGKELDVIELPGRVVTQMILDSDDLLFTTEDGVAYRFSSAGKKIWETNTRVPTRSSPAMVNNLFVFGNDNGEIVALNSTTGDIAYIKQIGGQFFSGLTISDSVIYAGNNNGSIYALDASDGNILWQFNTGARIKMDPAADSHHVYIGNLSGSFFSLNKVNGNQNWRKDFKGILNATPLVTSNIIILPDVLYAFHLIDKQNGMLLKSIPLTGRTKLSPVIHKNTLFIGFDDGILRAYEFIN